MLMFETSTCETCTSHTKHSLNSEDSTGRSVCWSGCQEVWTDDSVWPLSPHSCGCDEPRCSSASAALKETELLDTAGDMQQQLQRNHMKLQLFILKSNICHDCHRMASGRLVTSSVHVTRHDWVQVASLEVKQEARVGVVSLRAHQSVQNNLHTNTAQMKHTFTARFQQTSG